MGYVPLGMQYANRDQKFLIYRLLMSIGVREDKDQRDFMNALVAKEIDPKTMSKQHAITIIEKLQRIKAEKETQ
jgi:hypothetical protein